MSLYQLSATAVQSRLSAAGPAAAPPQPGLEPVQTSGSTQNALQSLTQFVPTEVVAVFVLGITLVTSSFSKDTALVDPLFNHTIATNAQAWIAWAWFDACLLFTVVFYYISFISHWRARTGGPWPHLKDCFSAIAVWQAIAAAIAFFLWGLSVAPSNVLLYPSADGRGVDPRPFAALASLLASPFFTAINSLFLPPTTPSQE